MGDYSKGYAFIQFLHEESVDYASYLMNGITLYGKKLRVSPAGQDKANHNHRSPASVQPAQDGRNYHGNSVNGIASSFSPSNSQFLRPSPLNSPSPSRPPSLLCKAPHGPGFVPLNNISPSFNGQYDLYGQNHINPRLHEARVHARDHPQWLRDETRRNLSHYHEQRMLHSSDQSWRSHSPVEDSHVRQRRSYSHNLVSGSPQESPHHLDLCYPAGHLQSQYNAYGDHNYEHVQDPNRPYRPPERRHSQDSHYGNSQGILRFGRPLN